MACLAARKKAGGDKEGRVARPMQLKRVKGRGPAPYATPSLPAVVCAGGSVKFCPSAEEAAFGVLVDEHNHSFMKCNLLACLSLSANTCSTV